MNGAILTTFDPADPANKAETEALLAQIRAYAVTDAVKNVTCEKPEVFNPEGRDPYRADALRLQAQHRALPCQARLQGDGHARLCNGRGNQAL